LVVRRMDLLVVTGRRKRQSQEVRKCLILLITLAATSGCLPVYLLARASFHESPIPSRQAATGSSTGTSAGTQGVSIRVKTRTNSIGMELVYLPGGRFLMGNAKMEPPVHEVRLSPFWIGRYEVTNAQFEQFKKGRHRPVESPKDNQPVTRITWDEAEAFCRWLSKKEGVTYRLPTDAEWEYAARGGLEQKEYPWGDEEPTGRAVFGRNESAVVGSFPPNSFGLYDMAGNVEEWVADWYDAAYYAKSPRDDPKGPPKPKKEDRAHIVRGGSFNVLEGECWLRLVVMVDPTLVPDKSRFDDPAERDGSGFRVVQEIRRPQHI